MVKKEIEEKKEVKRITVKELPKQEVRSFIGEDGIEYEVSTIEEAIDELREDVKEILRRISG